MTNFNQLVLREFVIEKIFVCIDLPLSKINSIQAQQIDVENYLTATKISSPYQQNFNQSRMPPQWVMNSPALYAKGSNRTGSSKQNGPASSSQGTPVMNLLNVYQDMKYQELKATDKDGNTINLDEAVFNDANRKQPAPPQPSECTI